MALRQSMSHMRQRFVAPRGGRRRTCAPDSGTPCAQNLLVLAAAISLGTTIACSKKPAEEAANQRSQFVQTGVASWYGSDFEGGKTASGERFDPDEMTAAHRTLPFGTMVRVTNLRNNRSIDVRIINRGPFIKGRIIDLSPAAARQLQIGKSGVVRVRIEASQARKETPDQRDRRD
jgi:rare lipoprotein A